MSGAGVEVTFAKLHGCGNDYLFVDDAAAALVDGPLGAEIVRTLCDRHRGVGADGVFTLRRAGDLWHATIRNADGGEGGVCGNGLRCAARLLVDDGRAAGPRIRFEIGGRSTVAELLADGGVRVDMGMPVLEPAAIPVVPERLPRRLDGLDACAVGMGNPHLVLLDDEGRADLAAVARHVDHPAFPQRTNVHLARIAAPGRIELRSWERGAGLTLACGTGACAALVAAVLARGIDRAAEIDVPGGRLHVRWTADDHVHLAGPATHVCRGRALLPAAVAGLA